MNEIMKLLHGHRSIRKFTDAPVPREQLAAILSAAQHASTSSNMQAYSVIRVTASELRNELSLVAGNQRYVRECPEFLVWCADLYRLWRAAGADPYSADALNAEWYTVSVIDAALAAQNAAAAAESLGFGIVYIGGLRNDISRTAALLRLPKLVVPLFGMCIGQPDQEPLPRPRLSTDAICHENGYSPSAAIDPIAEYDRRHADYMNRRSGGASQDSWSEQMAAKLRQPAREIGAFIRAQGYDVNR